MKTLYTPLLLTILLILSTGVISQDVVVFGYDDSGNRISRTIIWEQDKNDTIPANNDTAYVKSEQINEKNPEKHTAKIGNQTVNIYPNPNQGVFKITIEGWENDTQSKIQLLSLTGTTIIEQTINQAETEIQFVNQPDGTYLLLVTIEGKKESWKVIRK
jgi:hypothetical protein